MEKTLTRNRFVKPILFFLGAIFFFLAIGTLFFQSVSSITRVNPAQFLPVNVVSYSYYSQDEPFVPSAVFPFVDSLDISFDGAVSVKLNTEDEAVFVPVESLNEARTIVETMTGDAVEVIENPYGMVFEAAGGDKGFFAFRDKWLIFASSANAQKIVLEHHLATLSEVAAFDTLLDAMHTGRKSFVFVDQREAADMMTDIFGFGGYAPLFSSFTQMYPFLGIAYPEDMKTVSFRLVTEEPSLNRDVLKPFTQTNLDSLLRMLPQDNVWMFAGTDFESYYAQTFDFAGQLHSHAGLVIEGVMRERTKHMFGAVHDFEKDIFPLLEGGYVFGQVMLPQPLPKTETFVVLEVNDTVSLETLAEKLSHKASAYVTQVVSTENDNGETEDEVVAEETLLLVTESLTFKESVPYMKMENVNSGAKFFVAQVDSALVVTSSEDSLSVLLDAYLGFVPSLKDKSTFADLSALQFLQGDQIFYAEPEMFVDTFTALLDPSIDAPQLVLPEGIDITAVRRSYKDSVSWEVSF